MDREMDKLDNLTRGSDDSMSGGNEHIHRRAAERGGGYGML